MLETHWATASVMRCAFLPSSVLKTILTSFYAGTGTTDNLDVISQKINKAIYVIITRG